LAVAYFFATLPSLLHTLLLHGGCPH